MKEIMHSLLVLNSWSCFGLYKFLKTFVQRFMKYLMIFCCRNQEICVRYHVIKLELWFYRKKLSYVTLCVVLLCFVETLACSLMYTNSQTQKGPKNTIRQRFEKKFTLNNIEPFWSCKGTAPHSRCGTGLL